MATLLGEQKNGGGGAWLPHPRSASGVPDGGPTGDGATRDPGRTVTGLLPHAPRAMQLPVKLGLFSSAWGMGMSTAVE
jgi:hypothetical protein